MEQSKRLSNTVRLWWLCHVVWTTLFFYYVLYEKTWHTFQDDMNITCSLFPTVVLGGTGTVLTCNLNALRHVLRKVVRTVVVVGWRRYALFVAACCAFSYVLVAVVLDRSLLVVWNSAKESIVHRLEGNFFYITDSRGPTFNETVDIPDRYLHFPNIIRQNFETLEVQTLMFRRYLGEDVELECTNDVFWLSNSRPHEDILNITWELRDGKSGLAWSPRHNYDVDWKELRPDENRATRAAKSVGLSVYRVVVKLQIRLLTPSDFGIYRCMVVDASTLSLLTWRRVLDFRRHHAKLQRQEAMQELINRHLLDSNFTQEDIRSAQFGFCQPDLNRYICDFKANTDWDKVLPAARFTGYEPEEKFETVLRRIVPRFVLVQEMQKRTETVRLPPGAVVSFVSSYWQLEHNKEEIEVDYFINGKSIGELVSISHCSKLMLLHYWMTANDCLVYGRRYFAAVEWTITIAAAPTQAKVQKVILCLGPGMYGLWTVEYYRQFYNSSRKRYELVDASHPEDIFIQPQKQNLFADAISYNHSRHSSMPIDHLDRSPTRLEMRLADEFGNAESEKFHLVENGILVVATLLCVCAFALLFLSIATLSRLTTRVLLTTPLVRKPRAQPSDPQVTGDPLRRFSETNFDIYLSFSEADADSIGWNILEILEPCGPTLCFLPRDLPPNLPEMSATDRAIANSERFVIYLSDDYLENNSFEAETIVSCAKDRPGPCRLSEAVLVVNVSTAARLPTWLSQCTVHNWSGGGPRVPDLVAWVKYGNTPPDSEKWWLCLVWLALAALSLLLYFL